MFGQLMPFTTFCRRNLDYYQSSHLAAMTAVDPDSGNGELTIDLPVETGPLINGSIIFLKVIILEGIACLRFFFFVNGIKP